MGDAYIIDAVRTPSGRRGGGLSDIHPADLGAHVITSLLDRSGVPPEDVDDVIFGSVAQIGAQAWNVARTSWLSAGLPNNVPGVTLDRQCGSAQQAIHFGAQAIKAADYDLVIAGGVEVMSLVGLNTSADIDPDRFRHPFDGDGFRKNVFDGELNQFTAAELVADRYGVTREDMERFALQSHQRAATATDEGRFENEIVAIGATGIDEGIRRDTTLEKMATLKPIREGGSVTAAMASQVADGSAALLLASESAVERYGLTPRARIHTMVVTGADPVEMLTAPIPATAKALARAGMSIDDIDLFECNEAFAPVVLGWQRATGASNDRVNVNGGAIALGHPLGATGARLMTTLLNELERSGARFGLQTMCEGGGLSNATIIERL